MATQRPTARYRQVANELRDAINTGVYAPGELLPSQPSLARRYGLNQTSISRAMAILEAEGLVRTEHGRGSYVAGGSTIKRVRRIPSHGGGSGSSFAENMRMSGLSARTELVQAEIVDAPGEVAGYLDLAPSRPVLIRKRHMFADGQSVQLAASYIPEDVAGGIALAFPDTGPTGIHRRLADRGHRVVRFVEQVDARRPSAEEAEYFGLSSGQPVLRVVRFAYDAAGRALEVVINVFPSQLWSLRHEWEAENPPSRK